MQNHHLINQPYDTDISQNTLLHIVRYQRMKLHTSYTHRNQTIAKSIVKNTTPQFYTSSLFTPLTPALATPSKVKDTLIRPSRNPPANDTPFTATPHILNLIHPRNRGPGRVGNVQLAVDLPTRCRVSGSKGLCIAVPPVQSIPRDLDLTSKAPK
jgi:hypothetical protein